MKKQIYSDALRSMRIPIFMHTAESCLEGLLTVFTATIFGEFADSVFQFNFAFGMKNISRLVLSLFAMLVVLPVISLTANMFMLKYALVHDRMVIGRFLDKRYDSVQRLAVGDIQNRLDSDLCDFRITLVEFFWRSFMVPVTLVCLLCNALPLSPIYTLIVFSVSVIHLTVPAAVRKKEGRYDRETREYESDVRAYETEITNRPYTVKIYGLKGAFIERLDRLYRIFFVRTKVKSIRLRKLSEVLLSFTDIFCTLAILLIGSYLVAAEQILPGTVAAMYGYFAVFNTLIKNIEYLIRSFPLLRNLANRLEIFYEDSESSEGEMVESITGIRAENLSYAYDNHTAVNGRFLYGKRRRENGGLRKNGSGKSTLIRLMLGLTKGYRGKLQMDGHELSKLNFDQYLDFVAYAPQEPYLFEGTVLENIQTDHFDTSKGDIEALMRKMGIGYLSERIVRANGNELSGGEKQKISIARAVMKNTSVLFLDEPDNNLDGETVRWLCDFIKKCDKTVIYVSHDPVLIFSADKVLMLEDSSGG